MKKLNYRVAGAVAVALAWLLFGVASHAETITRTFTFEYNDDGLLRSETVEPDDPKVCSKTSYDYDVFGNRVSTSISSCAGVASSGASSVIVSRTHKLEYGSNGQFPITSTNALNHVERFEYDVRFGTLSYRLDANLLATRWGYDGFGRKTSELRSDGTKSTWDYKLCTESDARCPATTSFQYDWVITERTVAVSGDAMAPDRRQYFNGMGWLVRTQAMGFDREYLQDTTYFFTGRVFRRSKLYTITQPPNFNEYTEYSYDVLGRVLSVSEPDYLTSPGSVRSAVTSYQYNGRSTTVTNAKGQTRTTVVNQQDRVISASDAEGNTVSYQYDALGNLTQTNAAGSVTAMQYNQRSQKLAMQDPAMGSWVYTYNPFGELESQRNSLNQTTAFNYDALGRMVKRTEPDLVSEWAYDVKFDLTGCGRGKGKLCEAKTRNGYQRTNSYDDLGRISRTATVLDSVAAPAVVSVTYDANTGRVASKTWPTGYQTRYTYTSLGYLKSVAGGGTNGFAATHSYEVLGMNAHGQVTQYKTGNNVTTVSNYDLQTQRLTSRTATMFGQSAGNVLNQGYTYDSLGNLLTRNDTSPLVGTQESFSYDSLNRLTRATTLGGSVSPPAITEVLYDARGNIAYKSDVGRYWYDPARPNRMTQVTLETAPGATVALTGTRGLSYAFDDTAAGVQSINNTTIGNGNLSYTVSRDTTNNRHTVRYESYTSFNMPQTITYGNFIPNTTTCLEGYALNNGQCTRTVTQTNAAVPSTCPTGFTSNGTQCVQNLTQNGTPVYVCPTGYQLSGSNCIQSAAVPATASYSCTTGTTLSGTICYRPSIILVAPDRAGNYSCSLGGYSLSGSRCISGIIIPPIASVHPRTGNVSYSCPANYTLSSGRCNAVTTTANVTYTCPLGYSVSGTSCVQTIAGTISSYSCPVGFTLNGQICSKVNFAQLFTCPSGTLVDTRYCKIQTTVTQQPGSSNTSDRTLSFVYGPEHQRVKQNISLSGNGTSSYFSGNTWYLNGEDSLGLTYEKEVRDNGTTEHKHYLTAGGATFALFVSRSGALNGLPASSTSYLYKDHIGSISAITNEAGVVVERMAYDPWGKRRFINTIPGRPDNLDAIVGGRTDRGYTEHEHLDEVGAIHMNGRIYDPLMGRFMSADPIIQDPHNLRSYNRYSYVWNNPLKMLDPTGFFSWSAGGPDDTSTTSYSYTNADGSRVNYGGTGLFNSYGDSPTNDPVGSNENVTVAGQLISAAPMSQSTWNGVFTQRAPSIQRSANGVVSSRVQIGEITTIGDSTVFWLASQVDGKHFYTVLTRLVEMCDGNCKSKWGSAYDKFSRPSHGLNPTDPDFKGPRVVYGPVPFLDDPKDPKRYTNPGGRITQSRNLDGSITNTTLKDHVFCCGTITRGLVADKGGLYSSTVGIGYNVFMGTELESNFMANQNIEMGKSIFSTMDQQLKQYMNEK